MINTIKDQLKEKNPGHIWYLVLDGWWTEIKIINKTNKEQRSQSIRYIEK